MINHKLSDIGKYYNLLIIIIIAYNMNIDTNIVYENKKQKIIIFFYLVQNRALNL